MQSFSKLCPLSRAQAEASVKSMIFMVKYMDIEIDWITTIHFCDYEDFTHCQKSRKCIGRDLQHLDTF